MWVRSRRPDEGGDGEGDVRGYSDLLPVPPKLALPWSTRARDGFIRGELSCNWGVVLTGDTVGSMMSSGVGGIVGKVLSSVLVSSSLDVGVTREHR